MPTIIRRIFTREPMYLSAGFGAFFSTTGGLPLSIKLRTLVVAVQRLPWSERLPATIAPAEPCLRVTGFQPTAIAADLAAKSVARATLFGSRWIRLVAWNIDQWPVHAPVSHELAIAEDHHDGPDQIVGHR